MYIDPAYQKLLDCGIRPSLQRIEIMRYLLTHPTHPTIDEIFMELKKRIPTVSRTTIYNTLRMFSEKGGALMITIDEHHVCYDGTTTRTLLLQSMRTGVRHARHAAAHPPEYRH